MVSYYNTLAMFPNHHPHHPHHPAHRATAAHQGHPAAASAAAAAAYFSYAGFSPGPQHQHFTSMGTPPPHHPHYAHHPHHQFTAAAVAAAAAQAHASSASPGPAALGDLTACSGGGAGSSSLGLTPSPGLDNPCSSPPSSAALQSLHQHSGFAQQHQQQFETSGGLGGLQGASPPAPAPAWHSGTPPPIYGSSCARNYDDWPNTNASTQPPSSLVGHPHSPGSPTNGGYKFSSTLEFHQQSHCGPPPPPPPLQQPQDLSSLTGGGTGGGGGGGGQQHPSPDSGLAGSSDGVSSSAGSPQLQLSGGHLGSHHHPGGGGAGVVRPPNPRSPYEWMKKPSYHSQPNPVGQNLLEGSLSLQDGPGKTRTKDKYRVVYSDHQRLELEKEFHYSRYITIRRKSELAATLGLSERQVKIWFQNRRAKERKQVKKRDEMIQKEKMDVHTAVQMQQHHQQQLTGGAVVM